MITRRLFLSLAGSLFGLLALKGDLAVASIFSRTDRKAPPRISENVFTDEGGRALVGISGGSGGVDSMVREAVSLIGGIERLDVSGKRVLVKPNVVSGESHPATTNPEVVASVVRLLYGAGASRVVVGDMSALMTLSTIRNMRRCGILDAAEGAGAEVVAFEDYGWVEVELPGNSIVTRALVTEWIFDVDIVVNLPVIKTHRSATYSITLKNFIGCTHLKQRPYLIDSGRWEEIVGEFNAAYSPEINIVDGTVSMVEGGPWSGTNATTGVVIASGDRVGADVAGLGVIKAAGLWGPVTEKDVWDQVQVRTAQRVGAGSRKEEIVLAAGGGPEGFSELVERVIKETGFAGRLDNA